MDSVNRDSPSGRNRSITRTLLTRIIIASFLSMAVLIGLFTYWEQHDFRSRTESMRRDHVESQKSLVRGEVEKAVEYILYAKSQTEERLKEGMRSRVNEAHAIATNIYRENSGSQSDREIRKMIKDALRPVRFNGGRGYYFATNLDGREELFADRPGEEGKDYPNVMDTGGRYLVREMIEVVKNSGEGFVEYTWTKPGAEGNDFPKTAFVKLFEPLNYFIGTGEYLDDTTADIQAEVLRRIGSIRYAGNGYIFVVSYDGIVLSGHPKQKNVGKNLWEMEDPDGVMVIQEERRAVESPEGGFIRYRWPKPGEDEPSPKISFLKGIPDWGWMVGTGVYVDEMEPVIADMARSLKRQIFQRALLVGAVFFGLVLIMFSLAMRSKGMVKEGFRAFATFFEEAADDSVRVDESKLYFAEFKRLASPANRMVDERQQAVESLKRAKASLELQNEELRKIDRMKDALLRDVSHELKTPVAKHAMQLEILRPLFDEKRTTEDERRAFSVMEKSIRRQESGIRNLLNLDRLESGGRHYSRETFRLDKLVEKVLEDYGENIETRGIDVSADMPEISISSDIEMLWHVFSNLISNAIKFQRRDGSPKISISAQATSDRVIVKVEDNGIGMSREAREKIFTRFYQASASVEGSGVGLTICRRIVEDLGGSIGIASKGAGTGCVIEVTLPLV
jgi:signal transduction histidine kinase